MLHFLLQGTRFDVRMKKFFEVEVLKINLTAES